MFELFHSNTLEINQRNKNKLYQIIKEWYIENTLK